MSTQSSAKIPYPSSGKAWFLVGLLTVAYVLSYVDRAILGLLIEPIKADLNLTDEQIGWVLGPAFAIFYATMGLPLGWLVDRSRRTWIVGFGVLVWSLATAMSGLAKNFFHLFTARMAVGVGEATLSPSAMSMIADSFPPERRGKPISVYVAALSLGGGIASLIVSGVLYWAKDIGDIAVPLLGVLAPWQLTFIAVGLPGLLVGLIFFYVGEPPRRPLENNEIDVGGNSVGDAVRYIRNNLGTYVGFVSLACVMTIIAYSQGFMPAAFERTWGWAPEKYAAINGVVLIILGPASVISCGVIMDKWVQAGKHDAALRLLIIGALLMVPTGSIAMIMPTPELAYLILSLNTIGIAMVSTTAVTALLAITPAQIRGQITALYYMAISMTGLFLGPTMVGILSTRYFGEENLNLALGVIPIIFGLIPLLFIPVTKRLYQQQLQRLEIAAS